jgi:para-aminobenzoate synthetase component 1
VVTDPGSVRSFATVHHRVANVEAEVSAAVPWWELLGSIAPGGSVTGCPKWAAMEVIRSLEPVPRGPFTGALGVVSGNGDLEMALPIRTAWKLKGQVAMAAGCGIVWGSVPEREQVESRIKIAPWLELFERARRNAK